MHFFKKIPSGVYILIAVSVVLIAINQIVPKIWTFKLDNVLNDYLKLYNGKVTAKGIESILPDICLDDLTEMLGDEDEVVDIINDNLNSDNEKINSFKIIKIIDEKESSIKNFNDINDGYDVTEMKCVLVRENRKVDGKKYEKENWYTFFKNDGKWYCVNFIVDLIEAAS